MVVLIPKMIQGWDSSVYLAINNEKSILYASTNQEELSRINQGEKIYMDLLNEQKNENGRLLFPLVSNEDTLVDNNENEPHKIVGAVVLVTGTDLDEQEILLIKRYTELVSSSVVHRLMIQKTSQHLKFIKNWWRTSGTT